ncbi:DgyrCDS6696 [Dimorphilus gyrociliatus]|uniref:DgyrCDS6696 n=1 Tax=Dimorphilus gyrociliatus TaxID=2664684 RepID=A0A7I8VQC9_9ANNE|nr:DgyrCDS6696 [Dimorphilus gyrociliatus]
MRYLLKLFIVIISVSTSLLTSNFDQAQKDEFVIKHNTLRSGEAGSNLLKMRWDDTIAAKAQELADKCVFEHDLTSNLTGTFSNVGQNIFAGSGSLDVSYAVQYWFDEKYNFTFGSPCTCSKVCGHYTQVVWSESYAIGCGFKECSPLKNSSNNDLYGGSTAHFIVCNYGPPGNTQSCPYNQGNPCSGCGIGKTCETNLCVDTVTTAATTEATEAATTAAATTAATTVATSATTKAEIATTATSQTTAGSETTVGTLSTTATKDAITTEDGTTALEGHTTQETTTAVGGGGTTSTVTFVKTSAVTDSTGTTRKITMSTEKGVTSQSTPVQTETETLGGSVTTIGGTNTASTHIGGKETTSFVTTATNKVTDKTSTDGQTTGKAGSISTKAATAADKTTKEITTKVETTALPITQKTSKTTATVKENPTTVKSTESPTTVKPTESPTSTAKQKETTTAEDVTTVGKNDETTKARILVEQTTVDDSQPCSVWTYLCKNGGKVWAEIKSAIKLSVKKGVNGYCRENVHECCPDIAQTERYASTLLAFTGEDGVKIADGYPEEKSPGLHVMIFIEVEETNELCLEALKNPTRRKRATTKIVLPQETLQKILEKYTGSINQTLLNNTNASLSSIDKPTLEKDIEKEEASNAIIYVMVTISIVVPLIIAVIVAFLCYWQQKKKGLVEKDALSTEYASDVPTIRKRMDPYSRSYLFGR